ncbi:MAG: chromate transporter [Hyphomonadaceae bacterium]|nr:chromate transporter [Clostridia bacterium]
MMKHKYWQLFLVFLKLGSFTFGGGYAMVSLMRRELVEVNTWMTDDEFTDCLAVSQSIPGVLAVNTSIYAGYRVAGSFGAMVAVLGCVLPSFLLVLVLAHFYGQMGQFPVIKKVFLGVTAGVTAIIAGAVVKLGKNAVKGSFGLCLCAITVVGMVVFEIHPIWLILGGALVGVWYSKQVKQ